MLLGGSIDFLASWSELTLFALNLSMIGGCCHDACVEHEKLRKSQFHFASSDNGCTSLLLFFYGSNTIGVQNRVP